MLRFAESSNYGFYMNTGIDNVHFYQVPEPATLALVAIGAVTAVRSRRRTR